MDDVAVTLDIFGIPGDIGVRILKEGGKEMMFLWACCYLQRRDRVSTPGGAGRHALANHNLCKVGIFRGWLRHFLVKGFPAHLIFPNSDHCVDNQRVYRGCLLLRTKQYTDSWQQKFDCIPVETLIALLTWPIRNPPRYHWGLSNI